MREASRILIGKHDFTAFRSAGDDTTTVRNLRTLDIRSEGDLIRMDFEADGFLKHMVRNITGALVQVGMGKLKASDIGHMLRVGSRANAPAKAPARGLTLVKVEY
jgi:tRNA pseudouridine38-40 synthase